jgi:LacI family transcriptional regulator
VTAELVRRAIEQLGYHRNTVARALATSRTMTVGLGVPVTRNTTFTVLVEVIERELSAAGYTLMLHDTHDDPLVQDRVVRQLLELRADGIILAPAPDPRPVDGTRSPALRRVIDGGLPVVLIDRFGDEDCDQVSSDNTGPVRMLTEHLAALGHRRIAVITGLAGLSTTDERIRGYLDAVAIGGLDPDPGLVVRGESNVDIAGSAVRALFERADRPTAVVSLNNVMTIGAMRALVGLGLRVPQDVALVCFDDFEWAELFAPRLTTFEQDLTAMGSSAVAMLLARIADPAAATRRVRVAPAFHHRDSCGCPPAR